MVVKLIFILLISAGSAVSRDDLRNADAVIKTIQSEDGDIIDCVDIYKQPAFSHPALKDHQIQMKPSFVQPIDITSRAIHEEQTSKNSSKKAHVGIPAMKQIWQRSGSCPEGTVPIIRRPGVSNLLRPNHSLSVLITLGQAYLGAKADLGVYYPSVEDNDCSFTHITLENGLEQVRAGWAVNPPVHQDTQTRFTVYWTADGSEKTGCFDSTCPGFVQSSSSIAPGAALDLDPVNHEVMPIFIVKDLNTNNLWVQDSDQNVGYFPAELFQGLNHHATSVQWGGDVRSSGIGGVHPHTTTDMGNGAYANPTWSASIQRIRVLENSWELKYPETVTPFSDEYNCYSYFRDREAQDPDFFYGGPGQDPRCP